MEKEIKKRAHIFVSGLVQGVFFRSFTQKNAKKLGLSGWVRNTQDGRVEVVVEGEKERIEKLVEYLKKGPPLARVEKVEVNWENFVGEFSDFEIKYE